MGGMNTHLLPSENWQRFYEELDPGQRLLLLEEAKGREEESAFAEAAELVYFLRHPKERKKDGLLDVYLWQCVQLIYYHRTRKRFYIPSKRRVEEVFFEMGTQKLSFSEKALCDAFYWESRNTFRRYLTTCQSSNYRKKWFGLQTLDEAQRRQETAQDACRIGEGALRILEMDAKEGASPALAAARLWAKGVRDAYCASDAAAQERYEACRAMLEA